MVTIEHRNHALGCTVGEARSEGGVDKVTFEAITAHLSDELTVIDRNPLGNLTPFL